MVDTVDIETTAVLDDLNVSMPNRRATTKLRRFFKALYEGVVSTNGGLTLSRPTTNLVRMGVFGDSVGFAKPQFIAKRLRSSLGDAGRFFGNMNLSGGAVAHDNVNEGDYWINGTWWTVPAAGSLEFLSGGGRPWCDTLKLYYVKEPGAGTFKVQVNSGSGYVDEAGYTAVDAGAESIGLGIITLTKTLAGNSLKVVGVSGTVRILPAAWLNLTQGGLALFQMAVGGLPLTTCNQTPSAIKKAVLDDLGLDIAFMEIKDGNEFAGPAGSFRTFMNWFTANVVKQPDWVLIGSSPEYIETTIGSYVVVNNAEMEAYAAENELVYFDGYTALRSYSKLVELNWQGDGTHLPASANAYVATLLWQHLGLDDMMEVPLGRSINLASGEVLKVDKNATIRFDALDNATYPKVDVTYGGFDITASGGRCWNFRDAAGSNGVIIGTGQSRGSLQAWYLTLLPQASLGNTPPTSGPCLRPIGAGNTDGMYASGVSPGNGSTLAPFAAGEFRVGGTSATTAVKLLSGVGSPEGVVTAPAGSTYSRTDGGPGTTFYVKEGPGNTGWAAK